MNFSYTAVDLAGIKQKGLLEANNQKEVIDFLRSSKLTPLHIKVMDSSKSAFTFLGRVNNSDVVLFTRQLSSMITTGLTLLESLNILKQQTSKPQMRNLIDNLISNISEGNTFSSALSNHKNVFSNVYIALIRAAETGGLLDKVLARLADNLEKSEDLKKHVRSALFYPMIIVLGVIAVIVIMNIFVIPQLGRLYENLGVQLPLSTRVVLAISNLFTKSYLVMIGIIVGIILFYQRFKKTEKGRTTLDTLKLRIPIMGSILKLSILDEVARTLSLLISSGTSIIEALNTTSQVANNVLYTRAVVDVSSLVEKGVNLSNAFQNQNKTLFPPIFVQMIKVGESTGKIDDGLMKVSEYFDRDLNLKIKTLTTSLEPILIIVLGVSVAFLIIAVITPIYGLISQIQ